MAKVIKDPQITLEFKAKISKEQEAAIEKGIRVTLFFRNKGIAHWQDAYQEGSKVNRKHLSRLSKVYGDKFKWAKELNSSARQAALERSWTSISSFYRRCREGAKKKGYPKFQRDSRSIEYKVSGWKLSEDHRSITFTDKLGIGTLELLGTYDLNQYDESSIKRVRIVRRADGYYVQFVIAGVSRILIRKPTQEATSIDVGLEYYYTNLKGETVECPKFLRKQENKIKRLHRWLSRKTKKSKNYQKAKQQLALAYLKVSRQRKNFVINLARALAISNDIVVYEDLSIAKMAENSRLAKSIYDAAWGMFLHWLQYYSRISTFEALGENCAYSSWDCGGCGHREKKDLSVRWHHCKLCGFSLPRDHNSTIVLAQRAIQTLRKQNKKVPQGLWDSLNTAIKSGSKLKTPLDLEPLLPVMATSSAVSS